MHRPGSSTILAASFALLVLAGCKADSGKQDVTMSARSSAQVAEAATAPATPERNAQRPVIVCFGDSITAGFNLDPDDAYPAWLQRQLDAAGYHYRVVNLGVSGETTKDALARVPRVLSLHPAVVVVEFGGNDGLRGLPVADAQRNLLQVVRELRGGGTRVLVAGITLPPQYGQDYVARFDAMYPAVAHAADVPLLKFLYANVYDVPGDIQDDGVHPTAKGSEQVAKNVAASLAPLLQK